MGLKKTQQTYKTYKKQNQNHTAQNHIGAMHHKKTHIILSVGTYVGNAVNQETESQSKAHLKHSPGKDTHSGPWPLVSFCFILTFSVKKSTESWETTSAIHIQYYSNASAVIPVQYSTLHPSSAGYGIFQEYGDSKVDTDYSPAAPASAAPWLLHKRHLCYKAPSQHAKLDWIQETGLATAGCPQKINRHFCDPFSQKKSLAV